MRILFSMTNLDLGGAQMFVMRLAEELSSQGHDVFVFNHQPEWSNKDFQKSFSKDIKIISYADDLPAFITWKVSGLISRFYRKFSFRNWVSERKYRRTLIKYKFDIINSQMYTGDRMNAKYAVELKIPFVITTHGEYELYFSQGNIDFENEARHCLSSAEFVIYTAEKNIEAIRSLLPANKPVRKISVGFNGEAVKKFPVSPEEIGIGKNDFVIGMVARGIPEKGWNEVMEMFKILKKSKFDKKIHLLLIGNGEELKDLFKTKDVEDMHLLQFSKNTLEYFSWIEHFDVGVLLSYFKGESVPNVIIEYLYFNLPVLSTPMGDIKEMISSSKGIAGEIVPLKNKRADYEVAADILKKWLSDPALFSRLKNNTSAAFEKFNMKNVAKEYLEVYESAIANYKK